MRHADLLGAALLAVLAIGVTVVAPAAAAPQLKAAKYPVSATLSGGNGRIVAGSDEVACEKLVVKGEVTSATSGSVESEWSGCMSEGVKCRSEEVGNGLKPANNGEVWVDLPVSFVLLTGGSTMASLQLYYLMFLLELLQVKCGVIKISFTATGGGVLALLSFEEGVAVKAGSKVTLAGEEVERKQEATSCEEPIESCSASPIELLSEFVEGKPESSVIVQVGELTFASEVTPEG